MISLSLLDSNDIVSTFTKRFFDLQKISRRGPERRHNESAASLQKLVQPLMSHIAKKDLSKCDPEALSEFLAEACNILRLTVPIDDDEWNQNESSGLLDCCSWLCSLGFIGPAKPHAKARIASLVVFLSIIIDRASALSEPESFLGECSKVLAPLNLQDIELLRIGRIEFLLRVSRDLVLGKSAPEVALASAREWCGELIAFSPVTDELKEAAGILGLALPLEPKAIIEDKAKIKTFAPVFFSLPRRMSTESLKSEWEICLTLLLGIPVDEVLTQPTARRVGELNPETAYADAAVAMYFAGRDIWNTYWQKGDGQGLTAALQFAEFAYAVERSQEKDAKHAANSLHLFLNLQLPKLIRISALEPIRQEAEPLFHAEHCACNPLAILGGIIQAVAGSCRAAERTSDEEDRETLLILHGEQLRQLHKDYEKLARGRHTDEAWTYLEPFLKLENGSGNSKVDQNLVRLVNRANHTDVLTYIQTQIEQTRNGLERKLTRHRLSGDHLMHPFGKLMNPRGQARATLLPAFETGVRLLNTGEFERAAAEFEELATNRRLTVPQQNISRDYQAYALARMGKFIQAKPLLRGLCDSNYRFSSAYWNRACIETEREDQLGALVLGLERAPHLGMLEAAVYVSVVLDRRDDEQVCRWLSLVPFLEALVLQYHHEAARLEEDEKGRRKRDDLLKRISAYLDYGDPEIPDPTNAKMAPEAVIDLYQSLKQRDHSEMIGFWFKCHRPFETHFKDNRARTEYYKLCSDIWSDLGQPGEAAATFQEEIESHFIFLAYLLRNTPPERISGVLLQGIRSRLERQLRSCMAPDLEPVGRKLYRRVQEWENQTERKLVLLLDATSQRKIHEFYGSGVETLERVLIRVSGDLRANLHDTRDYPRQRAALLDLFRALETASKLKCVQTLQDQMKMWDQFLEAGSPDDQRVAALAAQAAFDPLRGAFEQELTREQLEMSNGILHAIKRVNGRHVPGPKVIVTPVSEAAPTFNGDGRVSAFGLRVRTEPGSFEARLTHAVARMQDTRHTFTLRDKLEVIPVWLRPDQSVLLTFEDDGMVHASGICNLEVELAYEHLGQVQETPAINVLVETVSRVPISIISPYIFTRALYPEEIEGRFFGRDAEQQKIIELLTSPLSKIGYIEGIRRTGKTSLFNSLHHRLSSQAGGSRLISVHLKGGSVGAFSKVGQVLEYFFSEICRDPRVAAAGVTSPDEAACCTNMMSAYRSFEDQLREKLPGHRIVAFWDDFQSIVELAKELSLQNQSFLVSTRALLDIIRDQRQANSRIIWLLAGFRFWMRFITDLPKVNLWAELEPIPIDFLGHDAVREIIIRPLLDTSMEVAPEAVARVFDYTQGYPEVVQRMAAAMLTLALRENRYMMTPADADAAAQEIGSTQGVFADTWCPLGELSEAQRKLIASFFSSVPKMGDCIQPHRLVDTGGYTENVRRDIDDLVARKILTRHENGATVGVKAPVLEVWMRSHWKDLEPPLTAAVFIDLANLTKGTGSDVLEFSGISFGDVVPGTFKLKTVLDAIDRYAADLVPTPVTDKWAVNYPPGSRAVPILNLNNYQVKNIDQTLFEKGRRERGSDDITLMYKIAEVTADHPGITHVVLVTGDVDLKPVGVDLQLSRGKSVHIVTHRTSASGDLIRLASLHPQKCKVIYLEELMEKYCQDSMDGG